ncbi:MAG: tetratricopeptide repeat protein, partial [Bacteroidota bacterium]
WINNLLSLYQQQPGLQGYYDYYCLGALYFHNDQPALAQTALEKQLSINDKFANTYYYLGLLKDRAGEEEAAQALYQRALDRLQGIDGGYSLSFFTELNVSRQDVLDKLQ